MSQFLQRNLMATIRNGDILSPLCHMIWLSTKPLSFTLAYVLHDIDLLKENGW